MFFHTTILLLSAAASTLATNHKGIPAAFSKGFDATGTTAIQVEYDTTGEVTDGDDLTGQDLTKVPAFALGDSSGINTSAKFIVLMLDPDVNGDPEIVNPQRLHYMRTDFTPGVGLGVQIASEVPPAVKYVGPEATTDAQGTPVHRYVYLLYKQPKEFALQGVDPENRDGFNVTAWREVNGLEPAIAGLHFLATVGSAMEGGMTVTQDVTQTSQVASTSCTSTAAAAITTSAAMVHSSPAAIVDTTSAAAVVPPPAAGVSTHFVTVTAPCDCASAPAAPPAETVAPPAESAAPPAESGAPPADSAAPPAAAAATHTVIVGGPAGLVYTPPTLVAAPGDLVIFDFLARNHTVTQSTLDLPCNLKADGVKSGFRANPNSTPGIELFEYTVPDAEPKWFYCAQGNHCADGMVFAINPKEGQMVTFLDNAKKGAVASNGTITAPAPGTTSGPALDQIFTGAAARAGPSAVFGLVIAGVMAVMA